MKVTAIVPVYNEEKTIGSVLNVLTKSKYITEVIVLNDGSTDNSLKIIRQYDVTLINFSKNQGKGTVIFKGINKIDSDIVLMCDADLIGLRQYHINSLLEPVLNNKAHMSIGIKDNPVNNLFNFTYRISLLSGERAMKTEHFNKIIKNPLIKGWGIETVINHYFKKNKLKKKIVRLKGMIHTLRVEKGGLTSFIDEMKEIMETRLKLRKNEPTK